MTLAISVHSATLLYRFRAQTQHCRLRCSRFQSGMELISEPRMWRASKMVSREAVGCERRLDVVSSVGLSPSFFTTFQFPNLAIGQCQEESATRSWWWRSTAAVGRGIQDDLQGVQQTGSLPWRLFTFLESIAQPFHLAPNHVLPWQREMMKACFSYYNPPTLHNVWH